MKFTQGLVIGKFYAPHRGHKLLIDTALAQSQQVTVIVCERATDIIPGALRAAWLKEIHPQATILLIDDRYDEHDTAVWARNTLEWLGGPPDAVFTSEDYGEPYAKLLGCQHVLVDRERVRVPCSGTLLRNDPYTNWDYLEPCVRGWFAKRVCVVGAESTGTTTLAQDVAAYYETVWVPEYGREYSAMKQANAETRWFTEEFVDIAQEQNRREERAACKANRVLICDTNSFATCLWHRRYLGCESDSVREVAHKAKCDLYLLTGDEIPFVQDGLRDGEHIRHDMHRWFEQALAEQNVPWLLVRGTREERLASSVRVINQLFQQSR